MGFVHDERDVAFDLDVAPVAISDFGGWFEKVPDDVRE
jgi:hypothetical protein